MKNKQEAFQLGAQIQELFPKVYVEVTSFARTYQKNDGSEGRYIQHSVFIWEDDPSTHDWGTGTPDTFIIDSEYEWKKITHAARFFGLLNKDQIALLEKQKEKDYVPTITEASGNILELYEVIASRTRPSTNEEGKEQ